MKKNKIIAIVLIILLLLVAFYLSPLFKILTLNIKFGDEVCSGNHNKDIDLTVITDSRCEGCFRKISNPDSNVSIICNNCAQLTNRCTKCGLKLH